MPATLISGAISLRDVTMETHLAQRMVGIGGGVHATATICDGAGNVLHNTPIRTNGPGGHVPNWIYNEANPPVTPQRRGDAELKVLADIEQQMANLVAHIYYVYIMSTHGPCAGCRQCIRSFANHPPHIAAGLRGTTVFYTHEGANLFGGQNGYGEAGRGAAHFMKQVG